MPLHNLSMHIGSTTKKVLFVKTAAMAICSEEWENSIPTTTTTTVVHDEAALAVLLDGKHRLQALFDFPKAKDVFWFKIFSAGGVRPVARRPPNGANGNIQAEWPCNYDYLNWATQIFFCCGSKVRDEYQCST